jgi:probable phosphoglycerate mutase
MTRVYLIRHGATNWIGKRLPGWTPGVHLNDHGRAQVEGLTRILADVCFQAIYTSPLDRAVETARPLARAQKLRAILRPRLAEPRPGEWEGKPLRVLRRRRLWLAIQHAPSMVRFPGGESFVEVQSRVVAELEALREKHPRQVIACVSHADTIKLAVAYYIGLPLDLFQRISISPASISILDIADGRARLLCLNDTRAEDSAGQG